MKKIRGQRIGNLSDRRTSQGRKNYIYYGGGLLVVIFFLTLLVTGTLNSIREELFAGTNNDEVKENNFENKTIEIAFPLAVAAKFSAPENDISYTELEQKNNSGNLYIQREILESLQEEEISLLQDRLGGEIKEWSAEISSLNEEVYPEDVNILLHPLSLNFKLKALSVEGKHVLKDADYPLSVTLKREVQVEKNNEKDFIVKENDHKEKIAAHIGLTSGEYVEFNPESLNRIFLGGEIIPARAVDRLFLNRTDNYTLLFDRFRGDMETADLTIAMLENPISGDPKPCTGCTTFVGDERNATGFKEVGIDILGFGNHAGDGGLNAIKSTEKAFSEAGVDFTGLSSKNLDDAARLVVRDFGGKKLGFLSADDVAWFYWAGDNRWGTNRFSIRSNAGTLVVDSDRIKKVITQAKSEVDYLVVMVSWGVEYRNIANSHQRQMAHEFIDNGADLIVSSHPHWVQNFEVYKEKPIFYSLGNFIFDQTHTDPTRQGIVVNAYYHQGNLLSFQIIPHLTCGYHQTNNNLADKIISGELTYEEADKIPEKQGCVYWQPKPLSQESPVYKEIWDRFNEGLLIK